MSAPWRYIADDGVSGSFGLAADEYLMEAYAGGQARPPTLRLYTYRSHCVLVGRFQNVAAELNLCFGGQVASLPQGIELNRRPTGGGTILMGADQLGIALVTPAPTYPQEAFQTYGAGIIQGLSTLGIEAQFRPKNDLEVAGRKIAGLGIYVNEGALLFHCSLLVDMDISLMLSLLNIPREKLADKDIASFAERLTTVRRETGLSLSVAQVRQAVQAGFEQTFNTAMMPALFTQEELAGIRKLEQDKYLTPEWIFQRLPTPDMSGSSLRKTRGGLLRVYVALTGEVIKSVLITGNFFAPTPLLTNLEARLKWTAATSEEVEKVVAEALNSGGIPYLTPQSLSDAILEAVRDAQTKNRVRGAAGGTER